MAGWFGKKKTDAGNFRADDVFDAGMEGLPEDVLDVDDGERMDEDDLPVLELGRMEVIEDDDSGVMPVDGAVDAAGSGADADGAVADGNFADGAEGAVGSGEYAGGAEGEVPDGRSVGGAEGEVSDGRSVGGAEGEVSDGRSVGGAEGEVPDGRSAGGAGADKVSADGDGTAAEAVKRKVTESVGNIVLDYRHYPGEDFYCDGEV